MTTHPQSPLLALSPCPFCGNPASIEWGPTGRYVGVECNTCGALGGEQKNIPHDADRDAFERLAITAWNTRAANARGDGVECLERKLSAAMALLAEVENYLAERSDVIDGDYGQPEPNEEMRLLQELTQVRALPPAPGSEVGP